MRGREVVSTDKPTVSTKPVLDPIVAKNSQGNGCLANPASTDEDNWNKVLGEIDCLLNQLVESKEGPWK